ncbi:protein ECERIFERUM 2 [Herrania umbratica]|uniref:Protein ECERIFERUM 2 n=1 Tax=Herrania umbratica TaxID=108875 RepID=A0A6J1A8Y2_9ROSI|nr:protein ECERIFERUM 2 [Herrania umbratica]
MVSAALESPVSGRRLSSVVPAEVTGDNKDFELSNMDLAMKLHYIKGVYLFQSEAVRGVSAKDLKEPMFRWLEFYFTASGRIRRSSGTGRPFIKCNDAGVRIVEAHCDGKTIDEWLATNDHSLDHLLAHDQVLGPDLGFSPLVVLQFTWFKCGGISIGLSWAHVLGDAFSASAFINLWGQIMAGQVPPKSLQVHNPEKSELPTSVSRKPLSLKKVDPVGDCWLTANSHNKQTYSFHVTAKQLHHMVSSTRDPSQTYNISHFEILSAMIWHSLSKIRGDMGPRIVTICSNNSLIRENEMPSNGMIFSTVEADFSVSKGEVTELAKLIAEKRMPENGLIEELLRDEARSDFIVYGANLTFVDLEEANLYGLELKGKRPMFVNYTINGVGDEGTVLILPGPEKEGGSGKIVTMTLPEDQLAKLKNILGNDWNIA